MLVVNQFLAGWLSLAFLSSLTLVNCSNILLEGGTVISFDEKALKIKVLRDTSILVSGSKISRIFSASTNVSIPAGTERISVKGKIISPGFVDTHRHLWQSQFRTIASNVSLAEYFNRYGEFTQVGTVYTADDVYYGQLAGIYESLNAGVTSILDHAHHTWSTATSAAGLKASVDSGARIWWCPSIHNLTNGYSREQQYTDFSGFLSKKEASSTTTVGLSYDLFAADPPSEVQRVIQLVRKYNVSVLTTHSLGGPWAYDNTPSRLNDLGFLNGSTAIVFSHGTYFSAGDALLLRSTKQFLSITPESEHHYGHGQTVSHLIQDQAALGVDTHFTYSADIIGQARLWLQRARLIFYDQVRANWEIPRNNPMSANQAFLLSTRAGAQALRRPDLGVLVEGATADIVVFDGDTPNLLGWSDPVAAVVLHSNVGDVRHVIVDGEFRKKDGKLIPLKGGDLKDFQAKFLESTKRIQDIWAKTPLPVYPAEFSPGIFYGQAVTVDAQSGPGTGY